MHDQTVLAAQLAHAKETGIYPLLAAAAAAHGLPLPYILAVGSREADLKNVIGDSGHGIGVLQIDVRSYDQAVKAKETGSWKTHPDLLINLGAQILAENLRWAQLSYPQYRGLDGRGHLKIAASAYNAGQGGATRGIRQGDSDRYTTGGDYGLDVMERSAVFSSLLA